MGGKVVFEQGVRKFLPAGRQVCGAVIDFANP